MKTAVYSRKSKFSETGESIENQITLCAEYAKSRFGAVQSDIVVYEDEGFSGCNTARPQFQQMLADARKKKFDAVICYRLDRVSRSIGDFSAFIGELESLGIGFVSLREQFDTSTPMGRAMMYIASVFAQLERETIAERVRDNMLQLAKTGRWLGGNAPTGYASAQIEAVDRHGNAKKAYKLVPVEREVGLVKLLFRKYTELSSIRKLETYCVQNDIKSKNKRALSRFALTGILRNHVYVRADGRVYDYLAENGYTLYCARESCNGVNGLMAYNKINGGTGELRGVSDWVVTIGAHEGLIDASEWLSAQETLNRNKAKTFRGNGNSNCLLSGLLRCGVCGSPMRPKVARAGSDAFVYMCVLKETSKRTKCGICNINGNTLDAIILSEAQGFSFDTAEISHKLIAVKTKIRRDGTETPGEAALLGEKIRMNKQAIHSLLDSVAEHGQTSGTSYIMARIDELAAKNERLQGALAELAASDAKKRDGSDILEALRSLGSALDAATVEEKRRFLRSIIERVTWDGEKVTIELFGENNSVMLPMRIKQ